MQMTSNLYIFEGLEEKGIAPQTAPGPEESIRADADQR